MQLNGMACNVCYRVVDVTHVIRVHVILYICTCKYIYIYIIYICVFIYIYICVCLFIYMLCDVYANALQVFIIYVC